MDVKVRLIIALVLLIAGFILMGIGHRAKKKASEPPTPKRARLLAEVGYWMMFAGGAYGLLHGFFGI